LRRHRPQRDGLFAKGPPDVLDYATSEIESPREIRHGTGEQGKSRRDYLTGQDSKLGMDAAKKIPGEGFKRPWPLCGDKALSERRPTFIKMDAAVKARVEKLFEGIA